MDQDEEDRTTGEPPTGPSPVVQESGRGGSAMLLAGGIGLVLILLIALGGTLLLGVALVLVGMLG